MAEKRGKREEGIKENGKPQIDSETGRWRDKQSLKMYIDTLREIQIQRDVNRNREKIA